MALQNFADAIVVITGGASGIGLATAQACYARGAHIVLADINSQRLEQAAQQVQQSQSASSAQILTVTTDVTKEDQVLALMQQAQAIAERIDLVVTCAGIGTGGAIDTFTAREMQTLMDINFMGTFHSVRAALPQMRRQQRGHFVLLSSVAGKLCSPLISGYCATKWAVRGFSASLRAELYGTGIGVTTVYPAWVDTPMVHQDASAMQFLNVEILLTPQQVAEEIIQAVTEGRNDLTLAPNHDIATLLSIMHEDQDKAERLAGSAFQQHIQQMLMQKNSK